MSVPIDSITNLDYYFEIDLDLFQVSSVYAPVLGKVTVPSSCERQVIPSQMASDLLYLRFKNGLGADRFSALLS